MDKENEMNSTWEEIETRFNKRNTNAVARAEFHGYHESDIEDLLKLASWLSDVTALNDCYTMIEKIKEHCVSWIEVDEEMKKDENREEASRIYFAGQQKAHKQMLQLIERLEGELCEIT